MSNRRLALPAAVVAFGAVLVPLGVAAGVGAPRVEPVAHFSPLAATAVPVKAASPAFRTFTSASSHAGVRDGASAGAGIGSSARAAAPAADSALAPAVTVTQISALSVSADATASTGTEAITDYYFAWGDGTASDTAGTATATHAYAEPGTYTVTLTITGSSGDSASTTVSVTTAGSDFTPYGPARLLDTRVGTGVPKAKIGPGAAAKIQIAGNGSIPASVTAVVLNVTVTNATGSGFVTVYGDGDAVPSTSNVNYAAGQTVPNLVVAPVGADGFVDLLNGGAKAGSVDLIADVTGYFTATASSGYTALPSSYRLVDTRNGTGGVTGPVAKAGVFAVQVAGADGGVLPATGITAVALNVTVTAPTGSGFLTAYPAGQGTPNASNVNYVKGQTIANSVVVPTGTNGEIDVYNGGGQAETAQIIVDVVGYYSAASSSAYLPVAPIRVLDTRRSSWTFGALPNSRYIDVPLSVGYPDITGWVLNATVTNTAGVGFLTAAADPNSLVDYSTGAYTWPTPPGTSNLNWVSGATVPNLVQAAAGGNGVIDFWNLGAGGGNVALIVDAFGYYQND